MSYEDFVRDYNDYSLSASSIRKRLGNAKYTRYYKKGIQSGDINRRPSGLKFNTNYIYYHFDKNMGKFRVHKVIKGKYYNYGYYDTEEEAKEKVKECKENNWFIE